MGLAELLVVSMVSAILFAALGVLFTGTLKASQRSSTHVAATAEARLAADVVARRLRVAVRPPGAASVFVEAGASTVTFYASLAEGPNATLPPSLVSYKLDGPCLMESITPASGPVRSTCLARGQVSLAFAYHLVTAQPTQAKPSPSPAPSAPLAFDAAGLLPAADLDRVGAVQVDLRVRDPRSTSPQPVRLSTRVLLVNRINEDLA